MNLLLISGSPRKTGISTEISHFLEKEFNDLGWNTDSVHLHEHSPTPCQHCDFCKKKDCCGTSEEANGINKRMTAADAIILISPVYFGGMSGQLKCLLDKTLPLRRNGFRLKGKVGAGVSVGGSRNGGQELTLQGFHAWMMIHGMIALGDNNHFGGTLNGSIENDAFGKQTLLDLINSINSVSTKLFN